MSYALAISKDPADAMLIAQFAQSEQPARWTPPAPAARALVRHLDALQAQRQAEHNRQPAMPPPSTVTSALAAHLTFLSQQIATVEQAIIEHINQHTDLKRGHELLVSISGIGKRTATRLLAEGALQLRGRGQPMLA